MAMERLGYGITKTINASFDQAIETVRHALEREGFGVITEIDIKATLRDKLDVEFRDYVILGACNPPIAHQALSLELDFGLLLPCNVVVYSDEGEQVRVSVMDPRTMLSLTGNEELARLAQEVDRRLTRAITSL